MRYPTWILGVKLQFYGTPMCSLNCWAISMTTSQTHILMCVSHEKGLLLFLFAQCEYFCIFVSSVGPFPWICHVSSDMHSFRLVIYHFTIAVPIFEYLNSPTFILTLSLWSSSKLNWLLLALDLYTILRISLPIFSK